MADKTAVAEETKAEANGNRRPRLRWDDTKMKNTYANVVNVSSTREEMTLLFGTNRTWHTGQSELTVELSDRIILNPYAAKRLLMLLGNVVKEYENRFGELRLDANITGAGTQG